MKIDQILKFAKYHFKTGYIAADYSGFVYWYRGKPKLGVHKKFWCNTLIVTEKNVNIKLICNKYKVDGSNWLWSLRKI